MFEEKDDTIMARWLAGELKPEEEAAFTASPEYAEYQRLVQGIAAFQKPDFDKERLRNRVWEGIREQKPGRVVRFRPWYLALGAAASILLVLGLFFSKVSYSTGAGETLLVALPDGTSVRLNAKTELKHRRFFWQGNKSVELEGEALFSVVKGAGFKVGTRLGTIGVLGTEFNIKSRDVSYDIHCYEGRIRFDGEGQEATYILNAGDALEWKGQQILPYKHGDSEPSWTSGKSSFSNAGLLAVIEELEAQYGVSFSYDESLLTGHYSGTFTHEDLVQALKSVFAPMGIYYVLSEDKETVVLNER